MKDFQEGNPETLLKHKGGLEKMERYDVFLVGKTI